MQLALQVVYDNYEAVQYSRAIRHQKEKKSNSNRWRNFLLHQRFVSIIVTALTT